MSHKILQKLSFIYKTFLFVFQTKKWLLYKNNDNIDNIHLRTNNNAIEVKLNNKRYYNVVFVLVLRKNKTKAIKIYNLRVTSQNE